MLPNSQRKKCQSGLTDWHCGLAGFFVAAALAPPRAAARRIVRMVDPARNTLVYLTYSDKLIDGSPQNSVTAVPVDRATAIPLRK